MSAIWLRNTFKRFFGNAREIEGTVYLHYPCFDGLASAIVATDFLETTKGWLVKRYRPVNYARPRNWLAKRLPAYSAVVDFKYHPDAAFWADHHSTAFSSVDLRQHFEQRRDGMAIYDRGSSSCAMLLWRAFHAGLSAASKYEELVWWADKIDSARYDSIEEALYGTHPAIDISLSLIDGNSRAYCDFLLRSMRSMPLQAVANTPAVRRRVVSVRRRMADGLSALSRDIRLVEGNIAVVDTRQRRGSIVSRYSPYRYYPQARYSVALIRSGRTAKITAMRNPWSDFESVQLGEIMKQYGGGGHQRVASVNLRQSRRSDPGQVLERIVADIQTADLPSSELLRTASA